MPPPFRILQLGSAYWQSRALYVAAELGVADAIGDDEMASDVIAERLNLHADYLYRLLRMLASIGVFEACGERRFRNNKLSDCLRSDATQSVRELVLLHNSPEMSRAWFEALGPALRNGEVPFVQSHGEELFDYLNHHPQFDALFTGAMESVEALTGTEYLDDFDWSRFERLVDVGGSNGNKALAILKRNPQMQALIFDRPQVIENAATEWRGKVDAELLARVTFSDGDMLETIPKAHSKCDIYLFTAIFHGMSDAQAEKILTNLRTACGPHCPTVAIIDCVAEAQHIDPAVAGFDMQMLIGTRGRERTETEWRTLLERGGFALQEIVSLRTFARLLVIKLC
ncbi:MAG: acetylserotonin O-methyltransferase [Candidatus Thiodiazotropha lotti]|nr:acetylserotonin O-methyltransferase [Candidatus Thiodiazotropha lotti]